MSRISSKQQAALDRLDRYIASSNLKSCDDAAFSRSVVLRGQKRVDHPVSGDEAFLLATDQGYRIEREDTTDYERFKVLMIAHRRLSITIAMWIEDIKKKVLHPSELGEFRELLPRNLRSS